MPAHFKSVREASGRIPHAVFETAASISGIGEESRRIGDEVFVRGFRQAAVARHVGVSRQRVHTICSELLKKINELMPSRRPG